jgi:filamentous hemagglutinin family protein
LVKTFIGHGLRKHSGWIGVSMLALLVAAPALSQALPTGGEVAAGSATVGAASPTSLTVTQTSARAILNWKSFSVGDGASVRFDNGRGATLNRVTGGDLSRLDGRLSASGSVYLINPAGVIVGNNGLISTGGTFLASSLDLPDASFLAGGGLTFSGSGDAGVVNLGRITATSGDILLIARSVENSGTLDAASGTVGLAAGTQVSLADAQGAGGRLRVDLGSADASVSQSGRITSAVAELKTQNGNIYALAGNAGGEILAGSLTQRDGKVWIDAGDGVVQVGPGARIAAASGADGGAVSISRVAWCSTRGRWRPRAARAARSASRAARSTTPEPSTPRGRQETAARSLSPQAAAISRPPPAS